MSGDKGAPARLRSVWDGAVEHLPPNAFSFVMATGITSTALAEAGAPVPSRILLVVAVAGFVVLLILLVARLLVRSAAVSADARDPRRAFGYFTIVAALGVLAVRFTIAGASGLTVPLGAAAVLLWLLLTYLLPANLILRPAEGSVTVGPDGSWLLWVVGTQSASITVSVVDLGLGDAAPTVAIALWGIGIVLYLMLATLILHRLLSMPSSPATMTPSYWILTGATAISVLAAARILMLPDGSPALRATAAVVSGVAVVLWAFGSWWVPLLLIFGVWRYGTDHRRVSYEVGLWTIVFPLGMYSAASSRIGVVLDLRMLDHIGTGAAYLALAAWAVAALLMVPPAVRRLRDG